MARAPLRLGLAGGGTDVPPYCNMFEGRVVNVTISKYAYSKVENIAANKVQFVSLDQQVSEEHCMDAELSHFSGLKLHRATYNRVMSELNNGKRLNLRLSTHCDVPIGSGLGSSSALVVSMLKALCSALQVELTQYELGRLAYQIERQDCQLEGGQQDQYAAAFGGLNLMRFWNGDQVEVLDIKVNQALINELELMLVLFYTGVSRESAEIISQQKHQVEEKKPDAIAAMHEMVNVTDLMVRSLQDSNLVELGKILQSGWESKKRTASPISNHEIEKLFENVKQAGSLAAKISGAGGGGFSLFLVPMEFKSNVLRVLKESKGEIFNCQITMKGAEAWPVS